MTSTGAVKVFLDYTQEELDRAYDQRNWADNAEALNATYAAQSTAARAALDEQAGIRYGSGPDETLDVFPARTTGAPICVFIHGGGWRLRNGDRQAFIAPNLVAHGIAAVVVHFSVIPDVRVPAMIEQARIAVTWVHAHATEFGGDAERIVICGHSSGGHMAGVLCTTDWTPYGLPADVVKGGCLISGMYDLGPVMLSSRRDYVTLSADEIGALSPIRHLDRLTAPLVVAHGTRESPEFVRQARDFAVAVAADGKRATLVTVNGANHFEMMEHFCDPRDPLGEAALELFSRPA